MVHLYMTLHASVLVKRNFVNVKESETFLLDLELCAHAPPLSPTGRRGMLSRATESKWGQHGEIESFDCNERMKFVRKTDESDSPQKLWGLNV